MLKLYRETLKEHDPFWNHEERILFGKSVPHLTKHGVENDEGTLLSQFTARYNHALQIVIPHILAGREESSVEDSEGAASDLSEG